MPRILAVAEQRGGKLRTVSGEVVSAARNLADTLQAEVHAAVLGPPAILDAAAQLGKFGAATVHVGVHDGFDQYSPDGFAGTLTELIRAGDYHTVLFPASAAGKDLAPRIAARLGCDAADVSSPTFTIVQEYEGRVRLQHVDLYRLTPAEARDLALEDLLDDAVMAVEWPDRWPDPPADAIDVTIDVTGEGVRRIVIGPTQGSAG